MKNKDTFKQLVDMRRETGEEDLFKNLDQIRINVGTDKVIKRAAKIAFISYVAYVFFLFMLVGAAGYTAVHFINKFW